MEQRFLYSTKFFEPAAYKSSIPKKVCLLPLLNNDPLKVTYLEKNTYTPIPDDRLDTEKRLANYNISLNQSFLKYIQLKNIFQGIEACETQMQEYRIQLVLQKYNWKNNFSVPLLIAGIFMAGIPLFFNTSDYHIDFRLELFRNSEKISEYSHKEETEFYIFEREVPVGAYKYVENHRTYQGALQEIYLDVIYDKLFEKIYSDAKLWK